MEQKINKKSIIRSILLFILILTAVLYFIFKGRNIGEIIHTAAKASPVFIACGLCCALLFSLCEAANIYRVLKLLGEKISFSKCILYALVGFFFSSVTPSSTGGQPMQIYYMYKDGISVPHSSLSLLLELACYQMITVFGALIGLLYNASLIGEKPPEMIALVITGISLNLIGTLIVLLCIFTSGISRALVNAAAFFMRIFHIAKYNERKELMLEKLDEYHKGADFIKKHKKILLPMLATTFLQITALHSIPFFVYRGLGMSEYGFMSVVCMQAVVFCAVAAAPLPGAVGVSESAFLLMYSALYSSDMLDTGMLLSRGLAFYFLLFFSGSVIAVNYFVRHRRSAAKTEKFNKIGCIKEDS